LVACGFVSASATSRRVERGGLARACRPRDEDHSVRVRDRVLDLSLSARLDAKGLQIEIEVSLVENTQHDFFTEERRQRRHPVVDDPVEDLELDTPVLRNPALGNVEARHDLEA